MKKFIVKKYRKKAIKHVRNRKFFAADCIKKETERFFNNLNPFFVAENKLFWETIKPFFSKKGNYRSQIKLVVKR